MKFTVTLTGSIYRPRLVFDHNPMLPYVTRTSAGWETNVLLGTPGRVLDGWKLIKTPGFENVTVAELQKPLLTLHKPTGQLVVLPRLGGAQAVKNMLGSQASWCPDQGWFTVSLEAARDTNSKHLPRTPLAEQTLQQGTPEIPSWFQLPLYDFQKQAAIKAASGHRLIAEPMGLGKTRIALAAAACHAPKKLLIVTPNVMVASWKENTMTSGFTGGDAPTIIIAKTKNITLPETGVVITTDTLLTARPTLATALKTWIPDVVIIDEAHRIKNSRSKRTKTILNLTRNPNTTCYALTGTPMLATPVELIPLLKATRTMHWFKNPGAFLQTYTYKTPWGQHVARRKRLPALKKMLDAHVWIRHPENIIANIPEMRTQTLTINPDLRLYREAHTEIVDTILDWASNLPTPPSETLIDEWCKQSLPHISRLRVAAGRCKTPEAIQLVEDWLDQHPKNEKGLYDDPLIVWCHHREVMDTLIENTPDTIPISVIRGGGTPQDTANTVTAFQNGLIPVLYASIHAAGVGITLTRATHALFVETDWTPAIIAQAQARIRRIGQDKTTISQTLIAPGTLDETIMKILGDKAAILTPVLGGNQDARPQDKNTVETPARIILKQIVMNTLQQQPTLF